MIDTTEAGGGSYPTPPETEEKLYAFTLECSATVERTIWAKNYDDALKQIEDDESILRVLKTENEYANAV